MEWLDAESIYKLTESESLAFAESIDRLRVRGRDPQLEQHVHTPKKPGILQRRASVS